MKIKSTLLVIVTFALLFVIKNTYATNSIREYNFYVKSSTSICEKQTIPLIIGNSKDEKLLLKDKIAPGTKGEFMINVNVEKGIKAEYSIKFENFANKLPSNLKFYYNNEEIDLNTFELKDISDEKRSCYLFKWEWKYENADNIDNSLSNIDFNIVLTAEHENIVETLPRSGDILTNN